MLYDSPINLMFDDIFLNLDILDQESKHDIYLKIEGLSLTGSIKVKSAVYMIEQLEKEGVLKKGMTVIESSSGNLGLALSMVCANKGYKFICVSDVNISPFNEQLIKAYGSELVIIDCKDENGGYLGSRIKYIKTLLETQSELIWVNQYENQNNVKAHYYSTAQSIYNSFAKVDYLFVGIGTTGTLGGVSSFFKKYSPTTKVIGVDTTGSVTFGGKPGKRFIPGLGTSSPPAIRRFSSYDDIIYINENETISMCRKLAKKGYFFGGSTGTVLSGVDRYLDKIDEKSVVVAISPDMGDKYLDTIYSDSWVKEKFGMIFYE